MIITVNGQTVTMPEGASVATAIENHTGRRLLPNGTAADGRPLALAAALGMTIVPRAQWSTHKLCEGDALDLVAAVQGG